MSSNSNNNLNPTLNFGSFGNSSNTGNTGNTGNFTNNTNNTNNLSNPTYSQPLAPLPPLLPSQPSQPFQPTLNSQWGKPPGIGLPNGFTNPSYPNLDLYYQLDSLANTNYVLNSNISFLNHISMGNYSYLNEQINKLKKEKDELEKKLEEHKRKFDEMNKTSSNSYSCCPTNQDNKSYYNSNKSYYNSYNSGSKSRRYDNYGANKYYYKKPYNKYQVRKYYPNENSWSEEKINEFLKELKSIKDIIKLKSEWMNIRHNEKLQKLANIIHPVEKLDKMIGLEEVKKEIFKIIVYYIQNPHTDEYLHTVIIGPPGVGKTQIAKIYSEIFVRLGILSTDKFVEIKRDDLVAKYLGQTAPRTKELLESAMGGVVFLDEGYSLGNEEKRDSFAKEAIDMINQYLSERKKDFMFVVAGYEDDLEKCFFSFNRGLKRRFSHWIEISKYSKNELVSIFESKVKDYGYNIDQEVNQVELTKFFEKNYKKFENYAGDIEKFLNYIKYEQSFRTFRENKQNKTITMEDLKTSIEKFKQVKVHEPPPGMFI